MGGVAHKFFLAFAPAVFGADQFARGKMRAGVEPAGQAFAMGQRCGFADEIGENTLRDIVGEVGIAANLPQRSGIDEIDVAADKFGEGVFGFRADVFSKQLVVRLHIN